MPRRETPRVDIMPVGERRKQEMLKLIDHLRLHVDDGTVTDLFIISGGDDGWSAQALWHDPMHLISVLSIAEHDAVVAINADEKDVPMPEGAA